MVVQIDLAQKRISIGVTDLCRDEERVVSEEYSLIHRAIAGQIAHLEYQRHRESLEPTYKREVWISWQGVIEEFEVRINGRIDGVWRQGNIWHVEEIKTMLSPVPYNDLFRDSRIDGFCKQLKIYCFLLSEQLKAVVEGELIIFALSDRSTESVHVSWDPLSVRSTVASILKKLIAEEDKHVRHLSDLRRIAKTLSFPFSCPRPFQNKMMENVKEILDQKGQLLISAPTGIGKTVGVLFPALKFAMERDLRLFFTTSKTTQQDLAHITLKSILEKEPSVKAITLMAKKKICPLEEFLCHPNLCHYLHNYIETSPESLVVHPALEGLVTPSAVQQAALELGVCPFELSLDIAMQADIIIADYNYVFCPRTTLKRIFDVPYKDMILIIDEAHNLYPRGREYYSPALLIKDLLNLESLTGKWEGKVAGELSIFVRKLVSYIEGIIETKKEEGFLVTFDKNEWPRLKEEIEDIFSRYILWRRSQGEIILPEDPVRELLWSLTSFLQVLTLGGEESAHIAMREPRGIKILCKDPSPYLEKRLQGFWATVAMSATLEPFSFFRDVLGFSRGVSTASFPSPFDRKNRFVAVYPWVSTLYKTREKDYRLVGRIISNIISTRMGNYFAFFSSFDSLKGVQSHIYPPDKYRIIVQKKDMDENSKKSLLQYFKESKSGGILFLAVSGGVFSEGVDYPGESLIGAIIIGPALPRVCLETNLIQEYFEKRYGDGFAYAYLYPGMIRVIQAAGRVIRSEKDRGVIVLLGERFTFHSYTSCFPRDWYKNNPTELICKNLGSTISNFWGTRNASHRIPTKTEITGERMDGVNPRE